MKPRSNTELKAELTRLKAGGEAFLARIDREYAERIAVGSEYTMIRVVYDISTDQLLPLPAAGLVLSHEGNQCASDEANRRHQPRFADAYRCGSGRDDMPAIVREVLSK